MVDTPYDVELLDHHIKLAGESEFAEAMSASLSSEVSHVFCSGANRPSPTGPQAHWVVIATSMMEQQQVTLEI